jgi:hypothetical protein
MITTFDKGNDHSIQSQKIVVLDIAIVSKMYLHIYKV